MPARAKSHYASKMVHCNPTRARSHRTPLLCLRSGSRFFRAHTHTHTLTHTHSLTLSISLSLSPLFHTHTHTRPLSFWHKRNASRTQCKPRHNAKSNVRANNTFSAGTRRFLKANECFSVTRHEACLPWQPTSGLQRIQGQSRGARPQSQHQTTRHNLREVC